MFAKQVEIMSKIETLDLETFGNKTENGKVFVDI